MDNARFAVFIERMNECELTVLTAAGFFHTQVWAAANKRTLAGEPGSMGGREELSQERMSENYSQKPTSGAGIAPPRRSCCRGERNHLQGHGATKSLAERGSHSVLGSLPELPHPIPVSREGNALKAIAANTRHQLLCLSPEGLVNFTPTLFLKFRDSRV